MRPACVKSAQSRILWSPEDSGGCLFRGGINSYVWENEMPLLACWKSNVFPVSVTLWGNRQEMLHVIGSRKKKHNIMNDFVLDAVRYKPLRIS